MAWDDQQPNWGNKKGPQTPEELIAALLNKVKEMFDGSGGTGGSGGTNGGDRSGSKGGDNPLGGLGKIVFIVGVLFLINVVYSSFYTLEPGERE